MLFPRLAAIPDLDYQGRLKLPSLREDLKALGVSACELPRSGAVAPIAGDTAEALGFAYVLEGATLGGRAIMKRLAAAGSPTAGTSFFDFYGNAAGARWKQRSEPARPIRHSGQIKLTFGGRVSGGRTNFPHSMALGSGGRDHSSSAAG